MNRVLIPRSDWGKDTLSALWNANKYKIVLVRSDNSEYYVSGIWFKVPPYLTAFAVEHYTYIPKNINERHTINHELIYLEPSDNLYLEQ